MIASPTTRKPSATRVLITGFGPFPNVPDNASGSLATTLGGHPELVATISELRHIVLPTSWTEAPRIFAGALDAFQPDLVVSFGVSRHAAGFSVETMARNVAAMADVNGQTPNSATIDPHAPRYLTSDLPARSLVTAMRAAGYPASRSLHAGRYLCNTLLFEIRRSSIKRGGFVHLPARLAGSALPGVTPKLTWPDAVSGAVMLIKHLTHDID